MPRILAIESSCDETSAAVIDSKAHKIKILSHITYSQAKEHLKTQGVVPEVAARAHIQKVVPITTKALEAAGLGIEKIDHIAVTAGPGLIASLLVGVEFAKGLSYSLNKPLLEINHMVGHLYSPFLKNPKVPLPNISLIVSGGHTYLVLLTKLGKYKVLGQTVDDAVGESFDKVAKMLNLQIGRAHV